MYLHLLPTAINLLFPHFFSAFSSFPSFTFCLTHLFTPGRRKATTRLLDLNLPHLFQRRKQLKKKTFLWVSAVYFPPPAAAVMMSLGSVFFPPPRLPWKAVPLSVTASTMLGFLGRRSVRLQVVGQQKITEPPKTAGEAPGSSSGRDGMI